MVLAGQQRRCGCCRTVSAPRWPGSVQGPGRVPRPGAATGTHRACRCGRAATSLGVVRGHCRLLAGSTEAQSGTLPSHARTEVPAALIMLAATPAPSRRSATLARAIPTAAEVQHRTPGKLILSQGCVVVPTEDIAGGSSNTFREICISTCSGTTTTGSSWQGPPAAGPWCSFSHQHTLSAGGDPPRTCLAGHTGGGMGGNNSRSGVISADDAEEWCLSLQAALAKVLLQHQTCGGCMRPATQKTD